MEVPVVTSLARFAVRRRRAVLAVTFLFVVASIVLGSGVVKRLSGAGFDDPAAASTRATAAIARDFHAGTPNFDLLVKAAGGVDAPAAVTAVEQLTARLSAEPGVSNVVSYWTDGHPKVLRSTDRAEAMILARLTGPEDDATARAQDLDKSYSGTTGPLTVRVGGVSFVY